jgi:4,5-dihydroxyphthalate decarboxylase
VRFILVSRGTWAGGLLMARLPVSLACWDYDRTRALQDGNVVPDGIDLRYVQTPAAETFFRMIHHQEFDVAEMSLSTYILSLESDEPPFVAIPVFPSRAFRHNSIYIHEGGRVSEPGDLAGATVGIPEYQVTAAVWIRGILAERHGVPVESVAYRIGGLHSPGRVEKMALDLPADIDYAHIGPDQTLNDMLVSGEVDAVYTPRTPDAFVQGRPEVRRLFENPREVEATYFAETGIFPVMHTVVIRRELYEQNPWMATSLYKAFNESKRLVESRLSQSAALVHMLPWLYADVEEARARMGQDYWPYGLDANAHGLEVFLRYSYEQGLAKRQFTAAELFAPETHEFVII